MVRGGIRYGLLANFFLPLAVLLITVSVAISGVLGYQNATLMLKNTRELLESSLLLTADTLDTLIAELDTVAFDILKSRTLYPHAVFSSGYSAMVTTERLVSYKNANNYLQDIVLYYNEDTAKKYSAVPRYFTTSGPFDSPTFWNYIHPVRWEAQLLERTVTDVAQPTIVFPVTERIRNAENTYLMYVYPDKDPVSNARPRGVVIFLLDAARLTEHTAHTVAVNGGGLYVYDGNGRVVFCVGQGEEQAFSKAQAGWKEGIVHSERLPSGNTRMTLRTAARHFTYVLDLPKEVIPSHVRSAILSLLPFLVALLLLGLVAAYALIRSLLKPLSQLSDMLAPYTQSQQHSLKDMLFSLSALESQKDRLKYQIERQLELSQMQCIHNLLHGIYQTEEEIWRSFEDASIGCHAARYVVLVASLRKETGAKEASANWRIFALQTLSRVERLPDECRFVVPLDSANEAALLCGFPEATSIPERLVTLFEGADTMLRTAVGASLLLGAGESFGAITGACASFQQAKLALEGCFFDEASRLHLYTPALSKCPNTPISYPSAAEEALLHALSIANYDLAATILGSALDDFRAHIPPVYVAKSICASIAHRLIRYTADNAHPKEITSLFTDALLLTEQPGVTLDAYEDALLTACASLCGNAGGKGKALRGELLCRRVKTYVMEHYQDQMLSLGIIADAFSLSEGHLARTFKEQTGTTVMQWLDGIRINHAQGLLRETNLSLDEIVARCGYWDKSNFIRKFKRIYHITPMQYREAAHSSRVQ